MTEVLLVTLAKWQRLFFLPYLLDFFLYLFDSFYICYLCY